MSDVRDDDLAAEEEDDEMTRLSYVGKRDLGSPGQIREKNIVSRTGTIRGVKNRVRAGIANYEGNRKQSESAKKVK